MTTMMRWDPFLTPFGQRGDHAGQQRGALQNHQKGEDEDGHQGHHGREDRPQHTQSWGGEAAGALAEPRLVALEVLVQVEALDLVAAMVRIGTRD